MWVVATSREWLLWILLKHFCRKSRRNPYLQYFQSCKARSMSVSGELVTRFRLDKLSHLMVDVLPARFEIPAFGIISIILWEHRQTCYYFFALAKRMPLGQSNIPLFETTSHIHLAPWPSFSNCHWDASRPIFLRCPIFLRFAHVGTTVSHAARQQYFHGLKTRVGCREGGGSKKPKIWSKMMQAKSHSIEMFLKSRDVEKLVRVQSSDYCDRRDEHHEHEKESGVSKTESIQKPSESRDLQGLCGRGMSKAAGRNHLSFI